MVNFGGCNRNQIAEGNANNEALVRPYMAKEPLSRDATRTTRHLLQTRNGLPFRQKCPNDATVKVAQDGTKD
ncbi:hypothetical protein ACVIGB_000589 [Bradyrhizobium sp. USDA 4341]